MRTAGFTWGFARALWSWLQPIFVKLIAHPGNRPPPEYLARSIADPWKVKLDNKKMTHFFIILGITLYIFGDLVVKFEFVRSRASFWYGQIEF